MTIITREHANVSNTEKKCPFLEERLLANLFLKMKEMRILIKIYRKHKIKKANQMDEKEIKQYLYKKGHKIVG